MRPSGLRQHAVVTYLTRTEAEVVDVARLLDGAGSAQPRSAWLVARAVERLQVHASAGSTLAAGALAQLQIDRQLTGVPRDGRKPAKVRIHVAAGLQALADLADRLGDVRAKDEAKAALASLRAPQAGRGAHSTMHASTPQGRC